MKNRKVPLHKIKNTARQATKMNDMAMIFKQAMAKQDYLTARKCCEGVLAITPGNPTIMGDYALTLMRTGDYQKAYDLYHHMLKTHHKIAYTGNWIDGLTEVCGIMGKTAEVRQHGYESLVRADNHFSQGTKYVYTEKCPPVFYPENNGQNIISFSLYGSSPKYCETLIKNTEIREELYPEWTCRVYHDNSVPQHVLTRLQDNGVQLVNMSHEKVIPATLWRFLVMDDPNVSRFLVRDADSLFSEKESAAVAEWVTSPFWFHHMRDYYTHTELLLAGLWGGCTGVIPSVYNLILAFMKDYTGSARFTDQYFLRQALWPTVRESILNHDELFHFHRPKKYPSSQPTRWNTEHFHVGSNASFSAIGGEARKNYQGNITVEMQIHGHTATYTAPVHEGRWSLPLPFFLIDEYQQQAIGIKLSES